MTDIIKQGAQILSPTEYEAIRDQLTYRHQLIFDGMLFTGMRMEEFWRFLEHPDWFHPDRQYVELPPGSMLKVKAKQQERLVLLSNFGVRVLRDLVAAIKRGEVKAITKVAWNQTLKRAVINHNEKFPNACIALRGVMPKMTRKTWISWLMTTYPSDGLWIAASSGHDTGTMIRHYLNLPFSTAEREAIQGYVIGWGGNGAPGRGNYQ